MNDDLDQLLNALHLKYIREILDRELDRATQSQSSYSELLARLFREEYLYRRTRSIEYRVKEARLPERWSVDTFPFDLQPGVSPAQIRQLAELDFVSKTENCCTPSSFNFASVSRVKGARARKATLLPEASSNSAANCHRVASRVASASAIVTVRSG